MLRPLTPVYNQVRAGRARIMLGWGTQLWRSRVGWTGLGRAGLSWAELGQAGLDWAGPCQAELGQAGPSWAGQVKTKFFL